MEEKPRRPQTTEAGESLPQAGPASGPLLARTRRPAGRTGQGYSRAGPRQAAEATGWLPHQVHGPPIGGQGEEHVVTDLFVAEHLLLEESRGRWSPLTLPAYSL